MTKRDNIKRNARNLTRDIRKNGGGKKYIHVYIKQRICIRSYFTLYKHIELCIRRFVLRLNYGDGRKKKTY